MDEVVVQRHRGNPRLGQGSTFGGIAPARLGGGEMDTVIATCPRSAFCVDCSRATLIRVHVPHGTDQRSLPSGILRASIAGARRRLGFHSDRRWTCAGDHDAAARQHSGDVPSNGRLHLLNGRRLPLARRSDDRLQRGDAPSVHWIWRHGSAAASTGWIAPGDCVGRPCTQCRAAHPLGSVLPAPANRVHDSRDRSVRAVPTKGAMTASP